MTDTEFIYTTYIKTTPMKLWDALTNPEFTRQYWTPGLESDWKQGSKWKNVTGDGTVVLGGEILESDPPKRMVMTWAEPGDTSPAAQHARVTYEIEAIDGMVCLKVIHTQLKAGSAMAGKVAIGWPRVLSSLKSLLETGAALDTWAGQQNVCSSTQAATC